MKSYLTIVVSILLSDLLSANTIKDLLNKPSQWFHSSKGKEKMLNVLSYQDKNGIWPKNINTSNGRYHRSRSTIEGTFDNNATLNELRLMALAFIATKDTSYETAFNKGLECILKSQYSNGGWPQKPRAKGYSQHITFNDGTMVGIMNFIREVYTEKNYNFVKFDTRKRCEEQFELGVKCIIQCQIKVDGKLTAWCAQHHKDSLEPMGARSYEHPSISGGESADVVYLLMTIKDPSHAIKTSIESAVEWFDKSKITGVIYKKVGDDRMLMKLDDAPAIWARFYDIKTNRPIFSGRDGKIKYNVSEIEFERRNGYAWYVKSGEKVFKEWAKWRNNEGS